MKKYILILCASFAANQAFTADFSGVWGYRKDIPGGAYSKYFKIEQSPKYMISGEWQEGQENGPSGRGKVKGYVKKGGKLHLSYCSDNDNSWYTHCPKYEKDRGYFVMRNGELVEYYRPHGTGKDYQKGDILQRQRSENPIVQTQQEAPEPLVSQHQPEAQPLPQEQVQKLKMPEAARETVETQSLPQEADQVEADILSAAREFPQTGNPPETQEIFQGRKMPENRDVFDAQAAGNTHETASGMVGQ